MRSTIRTVFVIILATILLFSCTGKNREKKQPENSSEFTGRIMAGVSMGGYGAAYLGTKYSRMFDIVAIMGGPTDWGYLLWHIRHNLMGGFLPSEKNDPITYEKWFTGIDDIFDRDSHLKLIKDLVLAFGNFLVYNPYSTYWPPPVTNGDIDLIKRITQKGCPAPLVLNDFYDGEYNNPEHPFCQSYSGHIPPDEKGLWPVITYCDGNDVNRNGIFDDPDPDVPVEVGLAVDCNGNGKRDKGEPVIRQISEPFLDYGRDGIPDPEEPGYDPVTNPDPDHDDYNFWTNPTGTEGNLVYDGPGPISYDNPQTGPGEPFEDTGIDGIYGTENSPYDYGEGNGKFDYNPNIYNMFRADPYTLLDNVDFRHTKFYLDAGVKDTFFFQEGAKRFIGKIKYLTNGDAAIYNGFDQIPHYPGDENIFFRIDWSKTPDNFLVLYGHQNLTIDQAKHRGGDGGHVGNFSQVVMRVLGIFMYISHHIPPQYSYLETSTEIGKAFVDGFKSKILGVYREFSVTLPPGYDDFPERYYPVVYFLHGYGMKASDMWQTGLVLTYLMAMGKLKHMIIVFPDGHSVKKVQGSFFVNHVDNSGQDGYRYEDYIIKELIPYIESKYRTVPTLLKMKGEK